MFFVVDPGEVCGLIVIRDSGDLYIDDYFTETDPYNCVRILEAIHIQDLRQDEHVTVVAERYNVTTKTVKMSRQYAALETIGALRYVAAKCGMDFELQGRSVKDRTPNEVLLRLGWWKPTRGGHANDAARHAWQAFLKHNPRSSVVKRGLGKVN